MSKKKKQIDTTPFEDRAALCPHFESASSGCGGCTYQKISYGKQLQLKADSVRALLSEVYDDFEFEGIIASPAECAYRNKMEFSFGDECKDGPFALGLHQRGSFMNIVNITDCRLVNDDINIVRNAARDYFAALYEEGRVDFRNNKTGRGYLRHLLLRRSQRRGEILIALVTASAHMSPAMQSAGTDEKELLAGFCERLLSLEADKRLEGRISGILHIRNESRSDVVKSDSMDILFGTDMITEEVCGLKFRISPFSFFQTNTEAAELLYEKAGEYAREAGGTYGEIFDLYCGTGTITQVMASSADHVTGVEIVEEAVEAARENAVLNGITNTVFIVGDVLKVIGGLEAPDAIILDPPREGINPRALGRILSYGAETIIYISCKPASLRRDLDSFKIAGYRLKKACCVDLFPQTPNIECISLLQLDG